MVLNWLRRLVNPRPGTFTRRPPVRPRSRRLEVEQIEDRILPTISGAFTAPLAIGVGASVNVSKLAGNQHESTIAINPTNPAQLFVAGVKETAGAGCVPVPLNASACGLSAASSVTLRLAARLPPADGVNVTEIAQVAPTGSDAGPSGQSFVCA